MKLRSAVRAPALLAALLVTAGCLDDDITGARPLTIELTPSATTVAVGESVTINYFATGTRVAQVTIRFGDGEEAVQTFPPSLVEVEDRADHSYMSAGTYVVEGEVVSAQGAAVDSVTITVN